MVDRPLNFTARRINQLAALNGATRYLEIGVAAGETFFGVGIDDKTAVDPNFLFDAAEHADPTTRFFEMPSDQFFRTLPAETAPYDVIFIDGLHTFEQTFRDFVSTRAVSHPDTIWLIDDVFPTDVYSALPTHDIAKAMRRRCTDTPHNAWHGDVFKVLFALSEYYIGFDWRTFRAGGNFQTVVVQSIRADFDSSFESWEQISRMTYFDLLQHEHYLNLSDEDELLEWAAAALDR